MLIIGSIGLEIFHEKQALYYLEGYGVDGLTLQPFARVKVASSYIRLYISLGDSLRGTSKNKRRKAIRYGKIPQEIQNNIQDVCWKAVKHYLNW